ncbi:type IV secretion system DNA-binding domain-containing protein [Chromobacterium phragmitis]|uniref:type IV secretion system DNA-binding domain-containing protein n=1 Tax=Chromobacterium amazonense TaxID=1382803 RepID=UPI0021B6ED45|nr:type IV secretion system DNA-binding domain-containing protein [Chromobacterium amazonense]MBM2886480.1 type IV secretion system DNA-binding domain-containing protein [Chromobacterium amazonense]
MSILNKDKLSSFIRGGDTLAHRLNLFLKNGTRTVVIFGSVTFFVWALLIAMIGSPKQRDLIYLNFTSKAANTVFLGKVVKLNLSVRNDAGNVVYSKPHVSAREVAMAVSDEYAKSASLLFWFSGLIAIIFGSTAVGVAIYFQIKYGKEVAEDNFIRGQQIVEPEELNNNIKEWCDKNPAVTGGVSKFSLGGVFIPVSMLTRGISLVGSMGGGKSQAMGSLLDVASELKMKMVVYDEAGEFVSHFYRPGRDVILNPLDVRHAEWQIFNDLFKKWDYYQMASYFVESPKEEDSNKMFNEGAVQLIADVTKIVHTGQVGPVTMKNVYNLIVKSSLKDLADLLRKYNVTSVGNINEENVRTSESYRTTATSAVRFWEYLPEPKAGNDGFSIRKWVHESESDSRLFLTSREDMREILKPYLNMWLKLVLLAAMTRSVRHRGHPDLFLSLDELASLGNVGDPLETVLTRGRKYGIVTAVGLQNLAQADDAFGESKTETMLSNLRNRMYFAVDNYKSAERLADILGKEDVEEKSEGTSYGVEANRDGLNISSKRTDRHVVTPTELTKRSDLNAYVRIAGDFPITKTIQAHKERPAHQPAFVERPGLNIEDQVENLVEVPPLPEETKKKPKVEGGKSSSKTKKDDGNQPNAVAVEDPSKNAPAVDDTFDRQQDQDWLSL